MNFNRVRKKLSENFSIQNNFNNTNILVFTFVTRVPLPLLKMSYKKKALKACSKLQRKIMSSCHNVNINLHLFDPIIAHILLYGCRGTLVYNKIFDL